MYFRFSEPVTQEVASSSLVTPAIFFPPFVFSQKQKYELGWCHKFAANPVSVKLLPFPQELPLQKKPADLEMLGLVSGG